LFNQVDLQILLEQIDNFRGIVCAAIRNHHDFEVLWWYCLSQKRTEKLLEQLASVMSRDNQAHFWGV
jgi:hypothetical protein